MKKLIPMHCFALAFLLLLGPNVVVADDTEWSKFLNNPSKATYEMLLQNLRACNNAARCKELEPSSEAVTRLERLVKARNPYAVDIAVLSRRLRLLDGGNLEDIIRALGQLAESDPKLLLTCLKKYQISGRPFERTFIMLPLETVDHIDARIDTLQRRIDSLSVVDDPSLIQERDQAILVIKRALIRQRKRMQEIK
jgi:hypothetical protein